MVIKQFGKRYLQNMEHLEFTNHVLNMAKTANLEKMNPLIAPLEAAYKAENEALNQPRALDGTADLVELDEERDRAFRMFQTMLDARKYEKSKDLVKTARAVQSIVDRYPNLAEANYDKESAMIDNLIDDLNGAEAKAWVTTLGLTEAIKRLDEGNKAFRARTQQRLAKGEASGSVDVKQLRQITDAALNAVLRRMDSLDDLFPSAEVTALIKAYNALVDGKQFLLAKRKATNEAATVRKKGDWGKMLAEHYALFEVERKLSQGSLSFTGNTVGSKEQRLYELAVADSEKTIWVRLKRKKLVEATADEVAKAKQAQNSKHKSKHKSGGAQAGAGGEHSGGTQGSATVTPKK